MATGDDIRNRLFALPATERADLVRQLLLSLEANDFDDDVQRAWAEEAERRSLSYEHGKSESRDWPESIFAIRETLKQRRQE